jgi:hypothetical protein
VLPLITAASIAADVIDPITTADIRVAVEVVIHIDVDVTATPAGTPTPATAPRSAHRQTDAKRDRTGCDHCSG